MVIFNSTIRLHGIIDIVQYYYWNQAKTLAIFYLGDPHLDSVNC